MFAKSERGRVCEQGGRSASETGFDSSNPLCVAMNPLGWGWPTITVADSSSSSSSTSLSSSSSFSSQPTAASPSFANNTEVAKEDLLDQAAHGRSHTAGLMLPCGGVDEETPDAVDAAMSMNPGTSILWQRSPTMESIVGHDDLSYVYNYSQGQLRSTTSTDFSGVFQKNASLPCLSGVSKDDVWTNPLSTSQEDVWPNPLAPFLFTE
jgi:hypothetical protein